MTESEQGTTTTEPAESQAKREAMTIALARIERLGGGSAVTMLVSDPMFFRTFCETFLPRHELVDGIAAASLDPNPRKLIHLLKKLAGSYEDTRLMRKAFSAGCVEVIVDAMKRHKTSAELAENACYALANITNDFHDQRLIVEAGAVEAVIGSLLSHIRSSNACEMACYALSYFSYDNRSCQTRIAEAGGVAALVSAITVHKNGSIDLLEEACCALWHILSTADMHRKFMSKEVESAVREISEIVPDSIVIEHCLRSITRDEDPAVIRARSEDVCSLVYAPHCPEPCAAGQQFYCEGCCVPMRVMSCVTCDSEKGHYRRICTVCWNKFHSGHEGVETFRPASCDQDGSASSCK